MSMKETVEMSYTIPSEVSQKAFRALQKAQTITLLAHHKPDGDALSSCAALSLALQKMGKQVETIYPGGAHEPVPTPPSPLLNNQHTLRPDLLIACDTANYDRMYYPREFHPIPLIVIDHHVSNELSSDMSFVYPEASSTCEIVFTLLKAWDVTISQEVAKALMFGLLTDTQSFITSNTTPHTLEVASALISYGANLHELTQEMIYHTTPNVIALWGTLMANVQSGTRSIFFYCSQQMLTEHGVSEHALAGFINMVARITRIDITAFAYEVSHDVTKVSFRSKQTDVNRIANSFGGGGHIHAAGAAISAPLLDVKERIIAALNAL